jgi:hypothetical protein
MTFPMHLPKWMVYQTLADSSSRRLNPTLERLYSIVVHISTFSSDRIRLLFKLALASPSHLEYKEIYLKKSSFTLWERTK